MDTCVCGVWRVALTCGRRRSGGLQAADIWLDVGQVGGLDVVAGGHVGGHGGAGSHGRGGIARQRGAGVVGQRPIRLHRGTEAMAFIRRNDLASLT